MTLRISPKPPLYKADLGPSEVETRILEQRATIGGPLVEPANHADPAIKRTPITERRIGRFRVP